MKTFKNLIMPVFIIALSYLIPISYASAEGVVVSKVEGGPMIIREGQEIAATSGMPCQANDLVKTGTNCSLDISMNKMAGCRVLAGSQVLIAKAGADSMSVKVDSGNVILNLDKLPADSSFRVETPTAVASVRGTQFWGRVDTTQAENPVTTFAVRQGAVEILAKTSSQTFMLEKGQALDIPKDVSVAPSVRPALDGEMQAMGQADTIATGSAG